MLSGAEAPESLTGFGYGPSITANSRPASNRSFSSGRSRFGLEPTRHNVLRVVSRYQHPTNRIL
jgi:hypothetical protein